MAVARTNPLGPGVYWIDLFPQDRRGDQERIFDAWASDNANVVHVIRKERGAEANVRLFTVFEVVAGTLVPFPFTLLGFPTIQKLGAVTPADREVKSSDTQRAPDPVDVSLDQFGAALHKLADFGEGLGLLVLLAGALYFAKKGR
jgi:hypothetical protein